MALRAPSSFFSTQITDARYYCPERREGEKGLRVVSAGWEQCRADYRIARDNFPWRAVELVVKGQGWLTLAGHRVRLRTGIFFCYGPGVSCRIETDPETPLLKYFADFAGAEAAALMRRAGLRPGQALEALYPSELREIFHRLVAEGSRQSAFSAGIANDYLRLLLQKLHESAPCHPGPGGSRTLEFYLRARAMLDEDFERLVSAEMAAARLGITPETLCRAFRRFSTSSPYQYLLRLKMNRAVDLLLGTSLLVKEVGQRVGFDDPFHFSRVFRQMQGNSPEKFRRIHQRRE